MKNKLVMQGEWFHVEQCPDGTYLVVVNGKHYPFVVMPCLVHATESSFIDTYISIEAYNGMVS